jgi:hypothetical protein
VLEDENYSGEDTEGESGEEGYVPSARDRSTGAAAGASAQLTAANEKLEAEAEALRGQLADVEERVRVTTHKGAEAANTKAGAYTRSLLSST